VHATPENKKVQYTAFYLLDDARLWYHRLKLNNGPPSWNRFFAVVNARFSPPLTESPIGELALLRHDGSIDDYCNKFMALLCCNPAITKDHQIQLFTDGFGQPLQTDVTLQKLMSLDAAVMLVRACTQLDNTRTF
jgi:hypothetical protein